MDLLRDLKVTPEKPLSLYDVGVPLVPRGYTQDELVDALFGLKSQGLIDLISGNRLALKQPLDRAEDG